MGRGLSELQKFILTDSFDEFQRIKEWQAECDKRHPHLAKAEELPADHPFAAMAAASKARRATRSELNTYGTRIHQGFYNCYDPDDWRAPTPAQRVAVSKAFSRLVDRGLAVKGNTPCGPGYFLTHGGEAKAMELLGNSVSE
jgi:hypothetical protein